MKKLSMFALGAAIAIGGSSVNAFADAAENPGADAMLSEIQGTYTALFPAFRDDKYDAVWEEKLAEYAGVDAEDAETVKDAFLSMYESGIRGEEAEKKAEEDPSWFMFDCSFSGGVEYMTVEGNTITGTDADGSEIFSNTYEYYDSLKTNYDPMTEMYMTGVSEEDWPRLHIFESDGADDEFKYFAFADDTPAETYHLEFRYGSDPEDLCKYFTGPYGYWMVSATYKDCGDEMMENCIDLFVEENADSIKAIAGAADESGESGVFASGTGTEEDPFVIETEDQFRAFADSVNDGSAGGYSEAFIRLDTDIDLDGDDWSPIGNMGDMENYSTIFAGSFDGNGHTISNLQLEMGDGSIGVGLFGVMTGSISNLNVENFKVAAEGESSQAISAVAGYLMYGEVSNISASGCEVSGNNCTGIIVGGEQYAVLNNLNVKDSTVTIINDNDFSDGRLVQVDIAEVGGLIVGGAFGGNIYDCTAQGTVKAAGNEPVGMGGIGGCLELMDNIVNCDADVVISSPNGGHAIGGLCGYSGTHSNPDVTMEEFGMQVENYPAEIKDCDITVRMDVPGATHVGGLVGTGLYYFGEETAFSISNCSVKGEISGAVTPGSVAGRAEGSVISDVEAEVAADGEAAPEVGSTDRMYESADQYEEDEEAAS